MAERLSGLMAEFETLEAVRAAVDRLSSDGYRRIDAYLPYPDLYVLERIGHRPSRITRAGGIAALVGATLGYGVQWFLSVHVYPLDVGGRPYHSAPAFIPVTFEMGILFCGIATFIAVLAFSGMPALWRPEFEVEGFERASVDRFWVYVSDTDVHFDLRQTRELLEGHAPLRIVGVGTHHEAAQEEARA